VTVIKEPCVHAQAEFSSIRNVEVKQNLCKALSKAYIRIITFDSIRSFQGGWYDRPFKKRKRPARVRILPLFQPM